MQLQKNSPNFATQIPQDVNLLNRILHFFRHSGRIVILCLQFLIISSFLAQYLLDEQLFYLNIHLQNKMATLDKMKPTERELANIQNKLAIIKKTINENSSIPNTLSNISGNLPSGLKLISLNVTPKDASFSIKTNSPINLSLFINNLKKDNKIKNVDLTSATLNTKSQEFLAQLSVKL